MWRFDCDMQIEVIYTIVREMNADFPSVPSFALLMYKIIKIGSVSDLRP